MQLSRRTFMAGCALAGGVMLTRPVLGAESSTRERKFHLSVSPDSLEADPGLLDLAHGAGVSEVWLTGFLYGYWYYSMETIQRWRRAAEAKGMAAHVINVPLGHPGDSLGAMSGNVPLTPPKHWKLGVGPDGATHAGTSLHAPATEENVKALQELQRAGIRRVFVDDDFRLARGPGVIGGCFCDEHKKNFLTRYGYSESKWGELLSDVRSRTLSPVLRAWVEFTCDDLSGSFREQQAAVPEIALGNMVMYLGAEKAGIRLKDYANAPVRVGELMFSDSSFGPIKGKTNELFSCLFHRRFVSPARAYSETTAYPSDKLSAKNMAAKLAVSTISGVQNTMYMSGLTCFPRTHWEVLGPAMAKHREIHEAITGHTPRGPLKHYWGEYDRMAGEDDPFSLFLALGVPFEVVDRSDTEGWTFIAHPPASDEKAYSGGKGALICREGKTGALLGGARSIAESLPALLELKREIVASLRDTPYVEGDAPVVCAWYPTADAVLLWNLSEHPLDCTLRFRDKSRAVRVGGLDVELIREGMTTDGLYVS